NNQLTREWLQQTIAELESVRDEIPFGIDTNSELELAAFKMALAAMDSEPVAIVEPSDYVTAAQLVGEGPVRKAVHELYEGALRIGDKLYRHAQPAPKTEREPIAWLNDAYLARGVVDGEAGSEDAGPGYIPVYREPATQPAPVVPPMQHWEELCRQYPDMSIRDAIIRAAWWNHCRAAMLQAGNSPVIPDGYVMVPKEPTDEMIAAAMNCDDVLFNIDDSFCVQFGNIYEAMLAAAPHDIPALNSVQSVATVPGKWIPVSERMPEEVKP
ncbi:hypothetical protein OGR44_28435, partial [Klebsiella oxytoca]|nr:hypothetical protein [Klebsiella oxytoca]